MKKKLSILLVVLFLVPASSFADKKESYRFIIVPKVVHPWFDLVHEGARQAAKMLEEWTGSEFILESIGNDFCEQAQLASHRLAEIIGDEGEVAIMLGVPTAPNHMIRARCHEETLKLYPKITIVARGIDNDEIEIAREQAAAIMRAHPNLKGWVACDAAGPIGIAQAIKDAGTLRIYAAGSSLAKSFPGSAQGKLYHRLTPARKDKARACPGGKAGKWQQMKKIILRRSLLWHGEI